MCEAKSHDEQINATVYSSVNRYGNRNATQGYFGGKLHSHRRLLKRRLKSQ